MRARRGGLLLPRTTHRPERHASTWLLLIRRGGESFSLAHLFERRRARYSAIACSNARHVDCLFQPHCGTHEGSRTEIATS
jgi:hypothetical protein